VVDLKIQRFVPIGPNLDGKGRFKSSLKQRNLEEKLLEGEDIAEYGVSLLY